MSGLAGLAPQIQIQGYESSIPAGTYVERSGAVLGHLDGDGVLQLDRPVIAFG